MYLISKLYYQLDDSTILKSTQYNLYITPHELLRPYISNYTISFPDHNMVSGTLTLIPDASGSLTFAFDGNEITSELWGTTTKIKVIGNEANHYSVMLFVELHPYGLYQFTGINQVELRDVRLPLEMVNKPLCILLCNALEQAKSVNDLVLKLNDVFLSLMGNSRPLSTLSRVLKKIRDSKGLTTVKEISASEHYSERHLNGIFYQHIGMSVKLFSRLVRINTAIRQMQSPPNTLVQLAQQTGFYDQSHFVNDFKSICGVTPENYLKNMSDFYNETLKL